MIGFLLDYWAVVLWVAAIVAAYSIGGKRLALAVGSFGAAALVYRKGVDDANQSQRKKAEDIDRRRKSAYDEIDRRGASVDDVRDKLRKGDY